MQSLRKVHVLLSVCVFASLAALGSAALGSAASEQMAAKRRISLQFRHDMQQCEDLNGEAADFCERQAHAGAEVAKAELEIRRLFLAEGRETRKVHAESQHKIAQARCNALSGRCRERCTGSAARRSG